MKNLKLSLLISLLGALTPQEARPFVPVAVPDCEAILKWSAAGIGIGAISGLALIAANAQNQRHASKIAEKTMSQAGNVLVPLAATAATAGTLIGLAGLGGLGLLIYVGSNFRLPL